ncbi:hypothetical protein AN964_18135 [Heyndrickxia shackletonii]|uniref:FHA domain-containing protein n=1 Tax=Heyndrickxia shackletonii TaxID=157838 RepID=A0A0Q3TMN2_9BACI|nr:FHA domain-containing protein [Heyndrickxia shackletonii]KQL55240.1 hypothetical protein AN964_18135 [Heyndrickxia shackletonii]MBB2482082.1 FHA domain-containing protein [Bacillus sp. APMAM]NEY98765.1 FHA domain-containing protein [Heyndrickxia shackletonii]RTZ54187.1 FHA domain-containing protein [Bacillus sp. SAJ1]
MQMQDVYLSIKRGETDVENDIIPLNDGEILLGRKWGDITPDISFTSQYISRKHALIGVENEKFYIVDLMSKHGTKINHISLEKNRPFFLRDGDIINLAEGNAILAFHNHFENNLGDTLAFPSIQNESLHEEMGLTINIERREILIDGVQIYLTSKDTELFRVLYQNNGSAVSYDEIKINVWPERVSNEMEIPDVGREEINSLVYRLRKKLGKYGECIISVPRYGYLLDLKALHL